MNEPAVIAAFFTPGIPAPQGSKRHVGRGILVESSKAVGPWRERVALAAHNAMHGQPPVTAPATVTLHFVMPRPKSAPKTRHVYADKRPDLDKLVRACLDAVTGVCLNDDAQVVQIVTTKRLCEPNSGDQPGVLVTIAAFAVQTAHRGAK